MIYLFTLLCFVTSIFILNKLYKNTNYHKNKFIDTHKFKDIPKNLEIVNLGSNQPKFAFDYEKSDVLGMNWGVGPQSFEYDFRILEQYHSFLKRDSIVLITICPFSFLFYKDKNKTASHKYYKFLKPSFVDGFSKLKKFLYIDYPALLAKKQVLRIIKDVKKDNRLELDFNPMNNNEIKQDAQKWINGWKKQFNTNDLGDIELTDEHKSDIKINIKILKDMIDFCLEQDYKPVLMILPVTTELSNLFPDEFIKKYILDYIEESNEKDVTFLNYWKDERFEKDEYYINSFFMNTIGRDKFTKQVLEDLTK